MHYIMSTEKSGLRLTGILVLVSIASEFGLILMKKKGKKETLNFRVSAEFKQRLIQEAGKERRSLTNYLESTLVKLWEERELSSAKGREPKRN